MSTDVTYFQSTDPNAPGPNDNTMARLLAILDACLITGYGTVTVASLSVTDGLATAVVDAGHGFSEACVVEIAGANETAFNGRHKITVISATQFAFPAGAATGSASGTITAKRASAQWSKPFSAADRAVYRSTDPDAYDGGYFLRVYPNPSPLSFGNTARAAGYQSMTDVDTGLGATDDRGLCMNQFNGTWLLIADRRAFWFFAVTDSGNNQPRAGFFFGDCPALRAADDYATLIAGQADAAQRAERYHSWLIIGSGTDGQKGRWLRGRTGIGSNIVQRCGFFVSSTGNIQTNGPGDADLSISSWDDLFVTAGPILLLENSLPRAYLPGAHAPAHRLDNGLTRESLVSAAGRVWMPVQFSMPAQAGGLSAGEWCWLWLDLTGPWR